MSSVLAIDPGPIESGWAMVDTNPPQNTRKIGDLWDNRSAPGGAGNTTRGLTHSSDSSREGLVVKTTRTPANIPTLTAERWMPVVGWEDRYLVSTLGRVVSLPKGAHLHSRILKPVPCKRGGYPTVGLHDGHGSRKMRGVHQLVLEAFVGPRPAGHLALHADDDPANCTLDNLRWGTRTDNSLDAVRNGRHAMANKDRCKLGHEFTPQNTWVSPSTGGRTCRACRGIAG